MAARGSAGANTNTGEGADASIIGDASTPCGVALDGSHLYWANAASNAIGRANTDSTMVNQSFIATGGNQICGVAVDSLAPPPPTSSPPPPTVTVVDPVSPPPPPHARILSGPGGKLARGIAKFGFESGSPASGYECRLDGRKAAPCKSPKRYRDLAPRRHTFRVWAKDGTGSKEPIPAKRRFRVPVRQQG